MVCILTYQMCHIQLIWERKKSKTCWRMFHFLWNPEVYVHWWVRLVRGKGAFDSNVALYNDRNFGWTLLQVWMIFDADIVINHFLSLLTDLFLVSFAYSTLLDLLANRKLSGNWSGDILFNQSERSKWFNRDSAYVLQDDVHISTLTGECSSNCVCVMYIPSINRLCHWK